MNNRELFLQHVAQTSPSPIGLEIVSAESIYQTDINGKKYIDLISMDEGSPHFDERTVVLDSRSIDTLLVYPL